MPVTIITGGSGLIGKRLTNYLLELGHKIIIFSRNDKGLNNMDGVTYEKWDPENGLINTDAIAIADYIIHLAGAGVMDHKWTDEYKKQIVDSRTKSSELLFNSLKNTPNHIKAFISASAIGWYGEDKKNLSHSYGFIETDPPAKNFLGETCLLWEESVDGIFSMNIRLVKLRFGIVLSNDGGAFPEFKKSLQFGLASILGNGKQVVSWIHIDDICRMIGFCIDQEEVEGVYNAVAPEPSRNKELILETAKKMKDNFFIPVHVPKVVIEMMMGKRSFEILKSTTVNSKKIRSAGFTFLYPTLKLALEELCSNEVKDRH